MTKLNLHAQEILVHIAQEGIATVGIFRRSGNLAEQKAIVKRLVEGKLVNCANCNHYTLTGVIKVMLIYYWWVSVNFKRVRLLH